METDDTTELDVGNAASEPLRSVLICAGQAFATSHTDGARLFEIGSALELNRGHSTSFGDICRFETADPHMSRHHAVLRRVGDDTVVIEDCGSRNGTYVNGKLIHVPQALARGDLIFAGAHVFVYTAASREDLDAIAASQARPFGPVPTMSPQIARLCAKLRALATSPFDLLLNGETGVGKEIFADAIHRESGRKGPFVALNCAAIPTALLESELFGAVRGAHSMAEMNKLGLIERAEHGTLFLDEIGDMPASSQSKLLRFLQTRQVFALGAVRAREMDVRVLAATRRPVILLDESPGVRLDVAARLGPQPATIPPLRTRREDIGLFARHFLQSSPRSFEIAAYQALFLHDWPGNVRELEKVLHFAAHLSKGSGTISLRHLSFGSAGMPSAAPTVDDPRQPPSLTNGRAVGPDGARLVRPSPQVLEDLLRRHRGNVGQIARELNRQRTLVWRWIRHAGLSPAQFR